MALIDCPECSREVSSSAPTYPGCGFPIATAPDSLPVRTSVTTTQLTSKRLKAQLAISTFLVVGSGAILLALMQRSEDAARSSTLVAAAVCGASLIWHLITRFRAWRHHG